MLTHIILSVYLISIAVFKPKFAETSFEIVTPQKIETNLSKEQMDENNIIYAINIEGKEYIIHLEKQIFLSSDFRVHTYSVLENLRSYLPNIETNCFYQGVIADIPNSFVTLRTCSGLRGLLQLENTSYIIKPLESSSTFQHLIYEVKTKFPEKNASELHDLDPEDEQIKLQKSMVYIQPKRVKESVLRLPKFLELYLILSKEMYQVMGEDTEGITTKMVQMISYLNTIYTPLNLHIILRGLEIWTTEDKVSTEGSVDDMLIRFIKWKKAHLIPHQKHDIAYLIISSKDVKSLGTTTFGKVCSGSGGAIVVYPPSRTIETFVPIFAHFLAHNLGIRHDDSNKMCSCASSICIMDTRVIETDTKSFSNCSIEYFKEFLWHESGNCLLDFPMLREPYRKARCGNGVLDEGEDCDCVAEHDCSCCDPATCTLERGAACFVGDCCVMCQFAPKGTVCRKSLHECDLPEYCSGKSKECPSDFYLHDGYPCSSTEHYCYKGFCRTHDAQCKRLLGEGSKACHANSFIEVNTQKDRFGNCGTKGRKILACLGNDIFCGKLICEYASLTPLVNLGGDVIYSKLNDMRCMSVDKKLDADVKDPFLVEDGIACDLAKVCVNQKCVETPQLFKNEEDCDQNKKCNARGVCNNAGNCHCIDGWAPPDCRERGPGGSTDSGQMTDLSGVTVFKSGDYEQAWKMWLLIGFSVLVPVLSLVAIIFLNQKLNITMLEPQTLQLQQSAPKSDSQLEVVSAVSHF
ncbi:disintegrin and metalloproteinase domain-containing protein 9-like [Microcaecilia unicolor]|uniref:Disintegrin and metalloproteinase domain-containing protein 9-like n=1 Tax=Microcaecilia unicolor TaxID=1415580 RepID=A0A6P7XXN5_9AMPH|nr:disintegrin and metalloproteinase domain-containing protein 9-like [Microcaecilia unicolor]